MSIGNIVYFLHVQAQALKTLIEDQPEKKKREKHKGRK
jgi:hypothetical protein